MRKSYEITVFINLFQHFKQETSYVLCVIVCADMQSGAVDGITDLIWCATGLSVYVYEVGITELMQCACSTMHSLSIQCVFVKMCTHKLCLLRSVGSAGGSE